MAEEQRAYRDRLFCYLFGSEAHKDWTLSLYNAVNDTAYTNPDDIVITTLTQVIYMGMHNDVAFLIMDEINMYEQQSTFNPNMPLRLMQYTGNVYEKLITRWKKNKYGKTLIRLPVPKLVVFYNGRTEEPDDLILNLSDAFPEEKRAEADISVRVRMININKDHSPKVVGKCKPLNEYTWLVSQIQSRDSGTPLEAAIDAAINAMPDDYVIKPFLEANKVEVRRMLLTEYDEARTMEMFKEEGRMEGRAEGEGLLSSLMSKLVDLGRMADIKRASTDVEFRRQLYKEFQLT